MIFTNKKNTYLKKGLCCKQAIATSKIVVILEGVIICCSKIIRKDIILDDKAISNFAVQLYVADSTHQLFIPVYM